MSKCLDYLEKYLMGHPGKIVSLEKLKSLYADDFGENLNRKHAKFHKYMKPK